MNNIETLPQLQTNNSTNDSEIERLRKLLNGENIDISQMPIQFVDNNPEVNQDVKSIGETNKPVFPLIESNINDRSSGRMKRYIFISRVGTGEFNNPIPDCECGDIFKFNNLPASQFRIEMNRGETLEFNQDDITNSKSMSRGETHPLFIGTERKNTINNRPSSFTKYYLNNKQVDFKTYINPDNFNQASTRTVRFTPQRAGTYYVASAFCGSCMGTQINVI